MNEEYNPYTRPQQQTYYPGEPQPPFNPGEPQPQDRNVAPQPSVPPIQPVQQQYPQQTYSNNPRPVPRRATSSGAARIFGIISFVIGCFVLPATAMIYFNFRSSVTEKFNASASCIVFLCVPALIFGIIALMKKTDKKLFPILGIVFAGVLMLCAFITYFVMVNTAPVYR